ncbi:hypothetical protein [Tautonia sociabilis]|uniref:Uncharacterized protein n=1 Tax=Tautonia sociabilis TaxID=2080755 RepID=A0A432MBV3_9BACT|nr:hypothetical protein [Tautonia sociabilis]RUL81293.1 hypothetical protein TsocGM_25290 [Tautonia sociabilis]
MAPGARRSHLLAEYLEGLADRRDRDDARAIRGFLAAWHRATEGDNALGLEIRVRRARLNMAVVFVQSGAAGPIRWLPTLVVPWTHAIERIGHECGDPAPSPERAEPARDVWGEPDRGHPPVLPKVAIRLVRP